MAQYGHFGSKGCYFLTQRRRRNERASVKPHSAATNKRLNAKALKTHNRCINSFQHVFLSRLARFLDVVSLFVFLTFLFSLASLHTVKVVFLSGHPVECKEDDRPKWPPMRPEKRRNGTKDTSKSGRIIWGSISLQAKNQGTF